MVLKFKDNNNITEALDVSSLGAIRFSSLEDPVLGYDEETRQSTGEIKKKRAELVFGDKKKISSRVTFPPTAEIETFKWREAVELVNPEFHLTYIAAQDGNREYYELDIYAEGLKKSTAQKAAANSTQSGESDKNKK
ncbi:DUF961 family protein [Enterococcus malodoratus]|uniref:DUF961 domain-containing protein n=1 Tax=Enterococcus malodoratus ATCC 43197 TaxID=1158601 RepID=R2QK87_9ENTE|nr:DUF961 family protein [Enterococcus malodoratus]EOH72080.1 hypothetical protein UAI_04364 [Enterococcus malodoratus ATCC 43197]EOT69896.1 hypothetical protein I585_01375 [Enterococcus malodoratus ATCC 43197]OJG64163.1 hypothetical protein RV07_GL000563 [Enterococcus malodoratus]SPW74981.1 Uncharacterised protein [Enterococcus malodoratus]STC70741.1 Uncharacterised protein [Enterococcus malodoratus]